MITLRIEKIRKKRKKLLSLKDRKAGDLDLEEYLNPRWDPKNDRRINQSITSSGF